MLALVLLPILLVSAYSAWFFYQGFRHDPALRAAMELVRHDGTAERVLGGDIQVTGIAGDSFSFLSGLGSRSAAVVALTGSKASGTLAVEAETDHGHVHIDSMILTGPDGTRYDLMRHTTTRLVIPRTRRQPLFKNGARDFRSWLGLPLRCR